MASEGTPVTISKACARAGFSRRSFYYQAKRRPRKINDALASSIKRVISALPYAGYRTVAWLLGENKNTVQRIFQLKGWHVVFYLIGGEAYGIRSSNWDSLSSSNPRKGRKGGYKMIFAFTNMITGNILNQLGTEFFPADLRAIMEGMPLLLTGEQIFFEQSIQSALYGIACATPALG
jgi:hypothetical protein